VLIKVRQVVQKYWIKHSLFLNNIYSSNAQEMKSKQERHKQSPFKWRARASSSLQHNRVSLYLVCLFHSARDSVTSNTTAL